MQRRRAKGLLVFLPVILLASAATVADSLPSPDRVIQRVLDRSRSFASPTNYSAWLYDKRTIVERLNSKGKVEERTAKLYRVTLVQGLPFSRLIEIEGRELTADEIKKENEREAEFRKKISGRDPRSALAAGEALITEDLVNRYVYEVLRRETNHGRQTLVISFTPKPGGEDEKGAREHLLNRLAGTLWIDEATADVARLQVHLTSPFSLGVLGVLGSVKNCSFELTSRFMPDGTWLPQRAFMALSARMLFSAMRLRVTEQCSNHRADTGPPETQVLQNKDSRN